MWSKTHLREGLIGMINERMINLCNTNIRLRSKVDTSHQRLPLDALMKKGPTIKMFIEHRICIFKDRV